MIKLIDISFYAKNNFDNTAALLNYLKPAYGYLDHLTNRMEVEVVHHAAHEQVYTHDNIKHTFFKSRNRLWYIPFKSIFYIKKQKANVLLVQGLGFPLQTIMLRLIVGRNVVIIAQHHAERPFRGIKKILQQLADRCINAYLFTAGKNAEEWFDERIITNAAKYNELLELSTYFKPVNKAEARKKLAMPAADIFLWVGRLEKNKDPLTVLRGFEKYAAVNTSAVLYMVYQEDDLLNEVKEIIDNNVQLQQRVKLAGKMSRDELLNWFSAADYYLSGSHREGSGTALVEAMACGCIPVVTDIPAFNKITAEGNFGFLYTAGNADSLFITLCALSEIDKENLSYNVKRYFENNLSFKAIATGFYNICCKLTAIEG